MHVTRRSFDSIMDHHEVDLASLRQFNLIDISDERRFDCHIESLSTDSFDNLSNLETFTFQVQLSTTTSLDLTSIEKLRKLNVLGIFNPSTDKSKLVLNLSAFEKLKKYNLYGFEVDLDEFRCLKTLGMISFWNCKLGHLISENFSEMSCLSVLNLFMCEIETLDADVFANLVNLTHLYLGWNRLTALHEDTFKKLTCLENVDLAHNQITVLKDNMFETNTKLHMLYLSKLFTFTYYRIVLFCRNRALKITFFSSRGMSLNLSIRRCPINWIILVFA